MKGLNECGMNEYVPSYAVSGGEHVAVIDEGTPAVEAAEIRETCHPRILILRSLLATHNSARLVLLAAC